MIYQWWYIGHQSLRLPQDSTSQPSSDSFATSADHMVVECSLLPAHRHGTHCQNVYTTLPIAILFLAVLSKHSSSQTTNVCSTLEAFARMRYINPGFTLYHVTLHCRLTNYELLR